MGDRLGNRVAIVTGGGGGVGAAVARLLAAEGAAVLVNDTHAADGVVAAIRAVGGTAVASQEPSTDFAAAERIVATAVRQFGRVDVLVNGAGVALDGGILGTSPAQWDAVIGAHLKAAFNCTRHAAAQMRQQRFGRIVSLVSTAGVFGRAGQAAASAAADGVAAFTRVVARDLGRYGITANAVCPDVQGAAAGAVAAGSPDPGGVAPWVVYLATDAARDVNGKVFVAAEGLVALLDDPSPVRVIQTEGRWRPEELAAVFPRTLGLDLVNPAPAEPQETPASS